MTSQPDRIHFLVIDDDPIFGAVAETVLMAAGNHRVTCSQDGAAGLAALRNDPTIETIILDLNMPSLDGLGFLRAISGTGYRGDVVISSGEADPVIESAKHLGKLLGVRIRGSLRKPLSLEAVRHLLEQDPTPAHNFDHVDNATEFPIDFAAIVPHYQPKFDLVSGEIVGLEALLRVRSKDGAILGPGFIFDRVKRHEDLARITFEMTESVLADLRHWLDAGLSPRVAINVDVEVLEAPETLERLKTLCAHFEVPPQLVTLELTERALPSDLSLIVEVLARARMGGFELSLDDFGTGGANFELFRLCPFNEIKIDQTFIRSADTDPLSRRFMEFCMAAAADRDIRIVAEGIETVAQRNRVTGMGIRIGQGFLMARPSASGMITPLLRKKRLKAAG